MPRPLWPHRTGKASFPRWLRNKDYEGSPVCLFLLFQAVSGFGMYIHWFTTHYDKNHEFVSWYFMIYDFLRLFLKSYLALLLISLNHITPRTIQRSKISWQNLKGSPESVWHTCMSCAKEKIYVKEGRRWTTNLEWNSRRQRKTLPRRRYLVEVFLS